MTADQLNQLSHRVIGCAIEVHRHLGPGLLESAYQQCLSKEFVLQGITFKKEYVLPIEYKGERIESGYRLDFLLENHLVVEVKAIDAIAAIHEAQLLSYLRLGGWSVGLIINFHSAILVDGIKRMVNRFPSAYS